MKVKKYMSYTFLFLWCLVIFYLSNQTSDVSGRESLDIISYIFNSLHVSGLNINVLNNLNMILRECMHSGVYFILGILAYFSFKHSFTKVFVYSLLFCVFYSLSDEIHQLFISGRAFELLDLTLDFIGSLFGIGLVKLVEKMCSND